MIDKLALSVAAFTLIGVAYPILTWMEGRGWIGSTTTRTAKETYPHREARQKEQR